MCPERQFTCKECNQTFRSPTLLRTHRLSQHPTPPEGDDAEDSNKTHRCGKCGRGYEEEAELLQHQENHAGNENCNGSTPIKRRGRPPKSEPVVDGEKKQKQIKTEEDEAVEKTENTPPAAADAETKDKATVKRGRPPKSSTQELSTDEENPDAKKAKTSPPASRQIPCSECDLVFPSVIQLRAHKKEKHTQRKAHACLECEESFNRPEQLEAHLSRAHQAGRYRCPTCGKSFGRESNLKTHQQTHEKEDEKPAGRGKR